jgi:tRNA-modifying protein YgfZ
MRAHLTNRAIIAVTGPDARTFLHGLLTNSVKDLTTGQAAYAALLSPQGKRLFDFLVIGRDGGLWIDTEADRAAELLKRLTLYRLRAKAEIKALPEVHVFAIWDEPPPPGAVADPRLPALGFRDYTLDVYVNVNWGDYARHRLALGVPEGSLDMGIDQTLILEANAAELHGVDFTKGCYVGQENTARMFHRSKIRRRLLPVRIDGAFAAEPRVILASDKEAGELRSFHGDLGMAWLRLEYLDCAAPLTWNGRPVSVTVPGYLQAALAN